MTQQNLYYDDCDVRIGRKTVDVDPRRMYVRASVSLPCGELDPHTGLPSSERVIHSRNLVLQQEQEKKQKELEAQQRMHGPCLSISAALIAVAALAFVLCIAYLSQLGAISDQQKLLNKNAREIEACVANSEQLTSQIAEKSDASAICYRAARDLGLIPAEAADAIYLSAVSARPTDRESAAREIAAVAANAAMSEGMPSGQ